MSEEDYPRENPRGKVGDTVEVKSRVELSAEIDVVRTEAQDDKRVHPRAQEEINSMLIEAAWCLEQGDTICWRTAAAAKIGMAGSRLVQARTQSMALGALLGVLLLIAAGAAAWAIYGGEYWPKLEAMPLRYVFFGTVLWGLVGGVIDGLRELHTRLARQQLDPSRWAWYGAHPLIGAGLGGIIFLIVDAGLLATGRAAESFNPTVPFLLATCAGFEQTYVIGFLRQFLRERLKGADKAPDEMG